jgi:hypothetical protein
MARNFLQIAGDPSSFIPYHFVWESRWVVMWAL